jgi:hypothetical protein
VQAARLLTWRATWMIDNGIKNNLEVSMCKAKALLVEKWMRDAKISDILRGHAADQSAHHRAPHPRLLVRNAAHVGRPSAPRRRDPSPLRAPRPRVTA